MARHERIAIRCPVDVSTVATLMKLIDLRWPGAVIITDAGALDDLVVQVDRDAVPNQELLDLLDDV